MPSASRIARDGSTGAATGRAAVGASGAAPRASRPAILRRETGALAERLGRGRAVLDRGRARGSAPGSPWSLRRSGRRGRRAGVARRGRPGATAAGPADIDRPSGDPEPRPRDAKSFAADAASSNGSPRVLPRGGVGPRAPAAAPASTNARASLRPASHRIGSATDGGPHRRRTRRGRRRARRRRSRPARPVSAPRAIRSPSPSGAEQAPRAGSGRRRTGARWSRSLAAPSCRGAARRRTRAFRSRRGTRRSPWARGRVAGREGRGGRRRSRRS